MPRYEYKVVPAPQKGLKGKGVRGPEARFSNALQELMNGLGGYGWEYLRAETLPSIERSGLASTTTEWRNVLVFRRPRTGDVEEFQPELLPAPDPLDEVAFDDDEIPPPSDAVKEALINGDPLPDNGVEDTQSDSRIGSSLNVLARARSLVSGTTETAAKADDTDTSDDGAGDTSPAKPAFKDD
ncbi:DUF4177 domain-containing protein [Sulfitobacter sp. S190]|uniref:DUF4177 domain-containing protein n=1 Tax=Sulfitobacter sp. S190 TaxID=2867022 RepID=UPI0021A715B7|nr:DUF4177 domain-containing protein [Sulfitobacter sp. S190]